jgi:hypothetical protein
VSLSHSHHHTPCDAAVGLPLSLMSVECSAFVRIHASIQLELLKCWCKVDANFGRSFHYHPSFEMSSRTKTASRNCAEKNAGNGSKRSHFNRQVSELASEIRLQMGAKMCAVQDKPGTRREQEDGKQTDARELWPHGQGEGSEQAARVLYREYEKYIAVKNEEQVFLLDSLHNSHLITLEKITEVKVRLLFGFNTPPKKLTFEAGCG